MERCLLNNYYAPPP